MSYLCPDSPYLRGRPLWDLGPAADNAGEAFPDALRERRVVVGGVGAVVHPRHALELGERTRRVEPAEIVQVVRDVAGQQDLPGPRRGSWIYPRVETDARRAVGGERVVETRPLAHLVHRLHVVQEHSTDIGARPV